MRRTAAPTAALPILTGSWRTVVRSTEDSDANRLSSNPVSETAPGTATPASREHLEQPDRDLVIAGDDGRGSVRRRSSIRPACAPASSV